MSLDDAYRLTDQQLTGHATLHGRYQRRVTILNLFVLFGAAVLCALTFVGPCDWNAVGVSDRAGRWIIAGAASILFFLSLSELLLKWGQRSSDHLLAAERLGKLKQKLKKCSSQDNATDRTANALIKEYQETVEGLARISERDFLKMKQLHARKVAISKAISERPGAPLILLRLELFRSSFRRPKNTDCTRGHDSAQA